MREVRLSTSLTVLFSQAVADRLGVHSTDIETMDLLHIFGPMTAGQLAERSGLTSGATTRLIDRLERAGFVTRRHDDADRRRVIIEPSWEQAAAVMSCFEPMGRRMGQLWSTYTPEQLAVIIDFMQRGNEIMLEENARLRGQPPPRQDTEGRGRPQDPAEEGFSPPSGLSLLDD
jgi:DNA-binding MarR family transcriptional regulator